MVSRAALIQQASEGDPRIVVVTAPAGYGKSVLLAEWARQEDRAGAWASLDRFDDDPVALLRLLASSFVSATGAAPALVNDMQVHAAAALSRAAPRLASALREEPRPFVFLIDD